MRNFKTGAATKEYSTPLERPILELNNELLLHSVECSVLPLGIALNIAQNFLKINFIKFPVMLQSDSWVVSAQLQMGFDNKSSASL